MKTLIKFKEFVDKINLEDSRNYKLKVLEKYKDDEDIKYYLNYIYNPHITSGISNKNYEYIFSLCSVSSETSSTFKSILEYLKTNSTGSMKDLQLVADFYHSNRNYFLRDNDIALNSLHEPVEIRLRDLFKGILTKKLTLYGIGISSINKIIPNLIPCSNICEDSRNKDVPKLNKKSEIYGTSTNTLYNNMIYIDGDLGFVFEDGRLTHCYNSISEVSQYEDSNGNLMLQIKYLHDEAEYDYDYDENTIENLVTNTYDDVFEVNKFEKIKVVNCEVIRYEFNI